MTNSAKKLVVLLAAATAVLLFSTSGLGNTNHLNALGLDAREITWLQAHPTIRVGVDPCFSPIEYLDETGKHQGIAAEFLTLIEKKLHHTFEIVHLKNWSEVVAQAKARQLDMFAAAASTPERLQYMNFTRPFVEFPAVVLVRDTVDDFPLLSDLKGKRVAVVAHYAGHEYMARAYPQVDLEVMPDISSGLRQVSFGKVDAMVLNMAAATYYISKDGITNLKVNEDANFVFDLSFAARNDWPLGRILDKTLATVTDQERKAILDRWIFLDQNEWQPSLLSVLSFLAVMLTIVLIGILHWNWILKKRIYQRTSELEVELVERLQAEKEKADLQKQVHKSKKMEAIGLLAGGVAHDLNNILSGVVGASDLLLHRLPQDNPERKLAAQIKDSGRRAAAVVADLLAISRNAAAEQKVVNVNDLVHAYLESPEQQVLAARFPEVVFKTLLAQQRLAIRCSEVHIKKCLMNLVVNAAEATQQGEVVISTELRDNVKPENGDSGAQSGKYVVLTVHDTGPGIGPEESERIFEPFYTKKEMGRSGTGLGLTVVWNTVHEHDGFVTVSRPEKGCQIALYFPFSAFEEAAPQQEVEIEELKGQGESILIIDDEEHVRMLAKELLQSLGYTVFARSSGEEALTFLKERTVDLLVLDMIMDPGMTGLETYKKIQEQTPEQKALIASGFSESQDVKQALQLGAGAYLKKPYTLRELGVTVKNILAG